jgi:hypothetical protein
MLTLMLFPAFSGTIKEKIEMSTYTLCLDLIIIVGATCI